MGTYEGQGQGLQHAPQSASVSLHVWQCCPFQQHLLNFAGCRLWVCGCSYVFVETDKDLKPSIQAAFSSVPSASFRQV